MNTQAYQQKNNTGAIFQNKRKETEGHPDGVGTLLVEGVEYYVSAWRNESRNGEPYTKLSVKKKEAAVETVKESPLPPPARPAAPTRKPQSPRPVVA